MKVKHVQERRINTACDCGVRNGKGRGSGGDGEKEDSIS